MSGLPDSSSPLIVLARKPGSKGYQPRSRTHTGPPNPLSVSPPSIREALPSVKQTLHGGGPGRGESVSSLPPYETLFFATSSSSRNGESVLYESEVEQQLRSSTAAATPRGLLPPPGASLADSIDSLDATELELDETILLDRLVLRSSVALATAQALLAGSLSVRGAVLDLNMREQDGGIGLERIETETLIRRRRDQEHADALDPLLVNVSSMLDVFASQSGALPPARKSAILSRRLEVGRGSVGTLSATRVEAEWTSLEEPLVDGTPSSSQRPPFSLASPSQPLGSGTPAPLSPLAARTTHNRSQPIVIHPAASTSSPSRLRRTSPPSGRVSPSTDREGGRSTALPELNTGWLDAPTLGDGDGADPAPLVVEAGRSTPTSPPAALPPARGSSAIETGPTTPDVVSRHRARPTLLQQPRSLSSFLPSLALPALPGPTSPASLPSLPNPADDAALTKRHSGSPSSAASSPAISRLRALESGTSSPSQSPPALSTSKNWTWFSSASPSPSKP